MNGVKSTLKQVVITMVVAIGFSGIAFQSVDASSGGVSQSMRPPAITEQSSGRAMVS